MTKSSFDLADLRRYAVKQRQRIRFVLSNGMECIVSETGIAKIPALQQVPGFNLEEMLKTVERFELLSPVPGERAKSLDRTQMDALVSSPAATKAQAAADHEE